MREIKFRAWGKASKRFYELVETRVPELNHGDVDDVIYMQYTGLKDKNGKPIYEGDILEITVEFLDKTFASEKVKEWVRMPSGDIVVKVESGESLWFNSKDQHPKSQLVIGEVIGNIYENPELL